mgnify:CR=1 FL=1
MRAFQDSASELALLRFRKLRHEADHDALQQERVLLEHIGEGLTNRQIAGRMFLAEKTIKNYVSRILGKLDMQRRTQDCGLLEGGGC